MTWYGTYIQNKLDQFDKRGKPKHTLAELLQDRRLPPEAIRQTAHEALGRHTDFKGLYNRRKAKVTRLN